MFIELLLYTGNLALTAYLWKLIMQLPGGQ